MDIDRLTSLACRIAFVLAFALLAVGVAERMAQMLDYTILRGAFSPWRLLEVATMALTLVIALLLRQIRETLRRGGAAAS